MELDFQLPNGVYVFGDPCQVLLSNYYFTELAKVSFAPGLYKFDGKPLAVSNTFKKACGVFYYMNQTITCESGCLGLFDIGLCRPKLDNCLLVRAKDVAFEASDGRFMIRSDNQIINIDTFQEVVDVESVASFHEEEEETESELSAD